MNASAIDGIMKSLKILIATALAFLITGIFSGCKKNNDKKPVCQIITATMGPQGIVYQLLYNSDGKLNRVTVGTRVTTFEYTGDTTIATTLNAGSFSNKMIIKLNAVGLATNIKTENNLAGTDWSNTAYEYSGEEVIKATNTTSGNSTPSITT
jgi:hypothetical protein